MAFFKKTWRNRIAEYINRRTLTDEDGNEQTVYVSRNEGTVMQDGDAFSSENMNDLENRINDAFSDVPIINHEEETTSTIPTDSDMLNGHPASYYATAAALNDVNNSLTNKTIIQPTNLTDCTLISGGYVERCGIIFVSMRIKMTTATLASMKIPEPLATANIIGGGVYNSTKNSIIYYYVTTSGLLNINGTHSANDEILINFSYLKKS